MGMVASPPKPRADHHVRISVAEVDRSPVDEFAHQLDAHRPGPYCLVVDLADVTFIDASGIRAILQAASAMQGAGGVIELRNARGIVRRLLSVVELEHLLAPR